MSYASAERLIDILKQKKNLYRIGNTGNKLVWFSTGVPAELPIGNEIRHVTTENISLPYGHSRTTSNKLTGWMRCWQHLGPRCASATAFISVSPSHQGKPEARIESCEPPSTANMNATRYVTYGMDTDTLTLFGQGLVKGLQTVLSHPLADVKIQILNSIIDADSNPKAFENLGQWLMEAMIIEMFKKDWLEG